MIDPGTLAIFALASAALIAVPGPAVLYIVTQSIHQGRRAGVASVLGIEAGARARACRSGGGGALRTACVLRRRVLGGQVRGRRVSDRSRALDTPRRSRRCGRRAEQRVRLRRVFAQGVLVNAFNPKVALFFLAFLPQFVDPDAAHPALQIGLFGLVFVAIAFVLDLGWALTADAAGGLLRRSRSFLRAQRYVSGSVYMAMGVATALAGGDRAGHAQSLRQP